ncbi:hypothetical protein [Nitrolancea hollandica]|uniref:Uncharacterized protein n=1 Tax=Nitrolancea hollandica Lb TaxID=1129897 RepID=I4EJ44_9BACT|nr:hypothetical protein [Nitrolancea hollandica]CCF84706.1 hypothetical protein NITHO_3820003 [Nitrolancea hollandica Lb]
MVEAPPPDELRILTQALQAAEQERRALLAEQFAIPLRIRRAIQMRDCEQLIYLKQRQNELPQHIAAAQVTVLQLRIRLLEIEHRVVADRRQQLQEEVDEAREAYHVACEQWEEAVRVQAAVETRLQIIGRRLSQLKRQLEQARTEDAGDQRPSGR